MCLRSHERTGPLPVTPVLPPAGAAGGRPADGPAKRPLDLLPPATTGHCIPGALAGRPAQRLQQPSNTLQPLKQATRAPCPWPNDELRWPASDQKRPKTSSRTHQFPNWTPPQSQKPNHRLTKQKRYIKSTTKSTESQRNKAKKAPYLSCSSPMPQG